MTVKSNTAYNVLHSPAIPISIFYCMVAPCHTTSQLVHNMGTVTCIVYWGTRTLILCIYSRKHATRNVQSSFYYRKGNDYYFWMITHIRPYVCMLFKNYKPSITMLTHSCSKWVSVKYFVAFSLWEVRRENNIHIISKTTNTKKTTLKQAFELARVVNRPRIVPRRSSCSCVGHVPIFISLGP